MLQREVAHVRLAIREAEVLWYLWHGMTRKQIALKLGKSVSTVKTYCERLQAKTGTTNDTAAVVWAINHRRCCLLPPLLQSEHLGDWVSSLMSSIQRQER